jgi:hypothetical protein
VDNKERTEKYLAQTGGTELTPKQRRRVAKKVQAPAAKTAKTARKKK